MIRRSRDKMARRVGLTVVLLCLSKVVGSTDVSSATPSTITPSEAASTPHITTGPLSSSVSPSSSPSSPSEVNTTTNDATPVDTATTATAITTTTMTTTTTVESDSSSISFTASLGLDSEVSTVTTSSNVTVTENEDHTTRTGEFVQAGMSYLSENTTTSPLPEKVTSDWSENTALETTATYLPINATSNFYENSTHFTEFVTSNYSNNVTTTPEADAVLLTTSEQTTLSEFEDFTSTPEGSDSSISTTESSISTTKETGKTSFLNFSLSTPVSSVHSSSSSTAGDSLIDITTAANLSMSLIEAFTETQNDSDPYSSIPQIPPPLSQNSTQGNDFRSPETFLSSLWPPEMTSSSDVRGSDEGSGTTSGDGVTDSETHRHASTTTSEVSETTSVLDGSTSSMEVSTVSGTERVPASSSSEADMTTTQRHHIATEASTTISSSPLTTISSRHNTRTAAAEMTLTTTTTEESPSTVKTTTTVSFSPESTVLFELLRRPFLSRNGYLSVNSIQTDSRLRESQLLNSFRKGRRVPPGLRQIVWRLRHQKNPHLSPFHPLSSNQVQNEDDKTPDLQTLKNPHSGKTPNRVLSLTTQTRERVPKGSDAKEAGSKSRDKNNQTGAGISSGNSTPAPVKDQKDERSHTLTKNTTPAAASMISENARTKPGDGKISPGPIPDPVDSPRRRFYLRNFGRSLPWSPGRGLSRVRTLV